MLRRLKMNRVEYEVTMWEHGRRGNICVGNLYVHSNEFVTIDYDEDEVCSLHIGANTIELECSEATLKQVSKKPLPTGNTLFLWLLNNRSKLKCPTCGRVGTTAHGNYTAFNRSAEFKCRNCGVLHINKTLAQCNGYEGGAE
jgi:predicted RNA-binding Zn-ribbon protein involved in translation (DUF1610 family)